MLTKEELENLIAKLDEVIKKNSEVLTAVEPEEEEPPPIDKTEWLCMWCFGVSAVAIACCIALAFAFFV